MTVVVPQRNSDYLRAVFRVGVAMRKRFCGFEVAAVSTEEGVLFAATANRKPP